MDWIQLPTWNKSGISSICRVFLHALPIVRNGLIWCSRDGQSVRLGTDPWTDCGNLYRLPQDLILHLKQHGIHRIADIADMENSTIFTQAWRSARDIGIPAHWHQSWDDI